MCRAHYFRSSSPKHPVSRDSVTDLPIMSHTWLYAITHVRTIVHTNTHRRYGRRRGRIAKSPSNYRLVLSERYNAKAWFTLTLADAQDRWPRVAKVVAERFVNDCLYIFVSFFFFSSLVLSRNTILARYRRTVNPLVVRARLLTRGLTG